MTLLPTAAPLPTLPALPTLPTLPAEPATPTLHWNESGQPHTALWRSERGAPAPKRVVLADDTLNADTAYRLACEGTALLWQGDFQNARQLLQALARRTDRLPERQKFKANKQSARLAAKQKTPAAAHSTTLPATSLGSAEASPGSPADAFHQHRLAQSQRARVLGMVLVPFNADYSIPLRRAPDAKLACAEAWGPVQAAEPGVEANASSSSSAIVSVTSLRELLGITSSHEWRKKGVEIAALIDPQKPELYDRIHPHYGVFSPVRGEYAALVAKAPLPVSAAAKPAMIAWDIGTGTGVLAAILARRGLQHISATDNDPRALACAADNLQRLGATPQVKLVQAELFPPGKAHLIVCNPPWLPARPGSPIERAIYDEGSAMLLGFLAGLPAHLAKGGEAWLVLSDIAEHLGLRSRAQLLDAFEANGLKVIARLETKPQHPKTQDTSDPLHAARAAELTSLWRLALR